MRLGWQRSTVAAAMGLSLLTACGQSEAPLAALPQAVSPVVKATPTPAPTPAAKKPTTTKPAPKASTPAGKKPAGTPTGSSSPTPQPSASQAPQVTLSDLMAANEAASSTQTWNSVIDIKKDGSSTTRTKTTTRSRQSTYRIDVLESTNTFKNGSRSVLTYGESTIKVKLGGILGITALSMALTDGKTLSENGWRVDQIILRGVLERLTQAGYQAQSAGKTSLSGTDLTVLKVTSAHNTLDADIDYELIGYDANKLVRLWRCYGKSTLGLPQNLMYQLTIERFDTNVTHSDDIFKL